MADDKTNRGEPDRSEVSSSEGYEVEFFARKHDLSLDQARDLIAQHGNDRAVLDQAAARLRSR